MEEVIRLPQEDDAFPSLVIRKSAETNRSSISTQLIYHHKLPLIPVDVASSREDLVCDVCVQPMSSPFYRCQFDGCHFLAHHICANHLPTTIQLSNVTNMNGALKMRDSDDYNNFICSVVPCVYCRRPSNGFVYRLSEEGENFIIDIECALSPKIIKHASHTKHLLYQSFSPVEVSCCSRKTLPLDTYRCAACNFSIHMRCALLPNKTHHKFDDHPLELIMSHEDDKQQELFCEVCEQEIELKLWYYGCHECDQYFHINCIPSVGFLSKVKFGKTHADHKLHHHPLTLTRMLTHGWHERCALCKQIIQGFAPDEMALHCSDCDFWIHFSCASSTTGQLDYSESLQELEEELEEELKERLRQLAS